MPLPGDLTSITVTGKFLDGSGTPLGGSVMFWPSQELTDSAGMVVIGMTPIVAPVSSSTGQFSVVLACTDNANLLPRGWTWKIQVTVAGAQQVFNALIPHSLGSTVDISALGPVGGLPSVSGTYVVSVNGQSGSVTVPAGGITPPAGDIGGSTSSPTVVSTHLSAPMPVAQGGTGQATQQAALNALAGAVTASEVLAGNGTNVTLRALTTADLPAGTGLQPWQFLPETYGAKGDGKVVGDVVTSSTTTITSATASFTSGDVGKSIMINGAMGTAPPLVTTIASVTNSTTAVLTAAANHTETGCAAVWGTDDTTAVNSAVAAAGAYATGHGYYAEVVFGAKYYVLASGPTQVGDGSTVPTFNTQIPLPYPNAGGLTQKLVIGLRGTGGNGYQDFWESTSPNLSGTALVSMITAPSTPDATFKRQSVIGGPSGGGGFTGGFANVKPVITGIQIVVPAFTNQIGFDFGYCTSVYMRESAAHAFMPPGGFGGGTTAAEPIMKDQPNGSQFQNAIGAGIRSPVTGNNADAVFSDVNVMGITYGVYPFDHFTSDKLFVMYAWRGLALDATQGFSSQMHRITIANFGCEQTVTPIWTNGSGIIPVNINLDTENFYVSLSHDIDDAGNSLFGVIRAIAPSEARSTVVNGAANVTIIDDHYGPAAVPKVVALAQSGGSVTVQADLGNVFTLTLTASGWAISNPTNPRDGQVIRIRLAQDATGGRTVTWGSAYDWGSVSGTPSTAPALSAGASLTDVLGFEYNVATAKWMSLGALFPQGF